MYDAGDGLVDAAAMLAAHGVGAPPIAPLHRVGGDAARACGDEARPVPARWEQAHKAQQSRYATSQQRHERCC